MPTTTSSDGHKIISRQTDAKHKQGRDAKILACFVLSSLLFLSTQLFHQMPDVERCVVAFSACRKEEEAATCEQIGALFEMVSRSAMDRQQLDKHRILCCCEACSLLPRLHVRTALVKDYDDLQPVLESSKTVGGRTIK